MRLAYSLILFVLVATSAAAAPVFVDTFDDGTFDINSWSAVVQGTGPHLSETGGRLELTIPGASTSTNGVLALDISTRFALRGDFDLQVDYSLIDWPHIDSKCALSTEFDGIERIYLGGDKYLMHYDAYHPIATTQMSGTMRLVRSGGLMTGYYLSGGSWVVIGQSTSNSMDAHPRLSAWTGESTFQHQQIRVAFDNFTINSGTIVPVPEPSSVLALASSMLGLMALIRKTR